jgi:hypothetical protein
VSVVLGTLWKRKFLSGPCHSKFNWHSCVVGSAVRIIIKKAVTQKNFLLHEPALLSGLSVLNSLLSLLPFPFLHPPDALATAKANAKSTAEAEAAASAAAEAKATAEVRRRGVQ